MTTFETLRALLVPYADRFTVESDTATEYSLEEQLPHHKTQFGVVQQGKRDVKLYFWPLSVFPELTTLLPSSLEARRMKSARSVLKLDVLSETEAAALKKLVARAWALIAERRKANPKQPYFKR